MNAIAPIGHNEAPVSATEAENIISRLDEQYIDLTTRHKELIDAAARLPAVCPDEDTAKKITTYGTQLKALSDALEERRKVEKAPYDTGANAVQSFFKGYMDELNGKIVTVKGLLKKFMDDQAAKLRAKAEEDKRIADAAAEVKRKEAAALVDQAIGLQNAGLSASAEKIMSDAHVAEQAATSLSAPIQAAAPAMMRGMGGGSAGTTGRWKAEILDVAALDLEALRSYFDREHLQKALNGYMKIATKQLGKNDPDPEFKGAKIFRETSVSLRG